MIKTWTTYNNSSSGLTPDSPRNKWWLSVGCKSPNKAALNDSSHKAPGSFSFPRIQWSILESRCFAVIRRFCDQNPIHFLGGPIQSIFGLNHNLVISCPESMASTAPLLSTARKSCDRNVSMGTWADEWKSRICVNMYIQHRKNMCIYAHLCKSMYVCTCM